MAEWKKNPVVAIVGGAVLLIALIITIVFAVNRGKESKNIKPIVPGEELPGGIKGPAYPK